MLNSRMITASLAELALNDESELATKILCESWMTWRKDHSALEDIADVSKKINPLRANLGLVPADLKSTFTAAADFQDEWIAKSEKIVTHGQPHHYNAAEENGGFKLINPDSVMAPAAYDMAFIMTNPYDFDKTPEANAARVTQQFEAQAALIENITGIKQNDTAAATLGHCFTVSAKRFWSIANQGQIEQGQVQPGYFLDIAKALSPMAQFDWK